MHWTSNARRMALGLVVLLAAVSLNRTARAQPAPDVVPDHYIVVLRNDVPSARQVADEHARRHAAAVSHIYEDALKGYAARIPQQALAALRRDPSVRFIAEDRVVEAVQSTSQVVPTGITRIAADVSSQRAGDGAGSVSGPAVAVIDTGSGPHPDLNVVGGVNCSTGTSYNDGNGHGTHVAGTIGARDNGFGVVGMAPGVPLYAVRVLNNAGSGTWSSVICGINWVTANALTLGIRVANMSLGGSGSDDGNCGNTNNDALHLALCNSIARTGVLYVVAAGNSAANLAGFVPAAYDEVLTVTAMADFNGQPGGGAAATCLADVDDTAADFSNFTTAGSADANHTIAAPGVCILSTWKGGGYKTLSGTSMATPHVTGTAVLCIATGACTGGPATIMAKLRGDAAARPASYGFVGDPNHPITAGGQTRYYGYLTYAGGY
ncbi:MAG: peptidase S8 [Chloroflexota bacterium]